MLGRNGVGKTSTLRAVWARSRPSAGRIAWDGQDITGLSTVERARRGIALVPQGREIFPLLTVEENLQTGFGAAAARRSATIPDAASSSCSRSCKTMLRRSGGDLSGGQQQQLAIGRALVMRPRLLVLDEPTEGIQPSIIKDIGRVLELLARAGADGHPAGRAVSRLRPRPRRPARGDGPRPGRARRAAPTSSTRPDVRRYLTV